MRGVVTYGDHDVRVEDLPDPKILAPRDAIVRVVAACVCGSDLWGYRGAHRESGRPTGHELVGIVEEVGSAAGDLKAGDFVISPFSLSDGTCQACRHGMTSSCDHSAGFGSKDTDGLWVDGAQGQKVRIALADSSLVVVPGPVDDARVPDLLALADVMSTGHHAAVSGGVGPETVVTVVGDGAVGLSAILAAKRLGASRIIAMSRHESRQKLAREFGATEVIAERGDDAIDALRSLLGGDLADVALECVGTKESMKQALDSVRGGGRVGYVGVPAGGPELPVGYLFRRNITIGGGMAPVRAYLPELLADVLAGTIAPGRVFDLEVSLEEAPEAYAAMDERRAIKSLIRM